MRIYGHIGWYDDDSGEFEDGRALCGKAVSRRKVAPFLVCGKCVKKMIDQIPPQTVYVREWSVSR